MITEVKIMNNNYCSNAFGLCSSLTSKGFDGIMMLNDTGCLMWHLLEKDADIKSLAAALCAEYKVDEATARKDEKAFVTKLISCGAVEK